MTYPDFKNFPDTFPTLISEYIKTSRIVNIGRDTLLYKAYPDPLQITSADPDLLQALNRWLIIGTPWEENKLKEIETEENGT